MSNFLKVQEQKVISVAVPIINYRLQIAERFGAKRPEVLKKAGVHTDKLSEPTGRIVLEEELVLWKTMVAETGREDLGLICGLNFPIQSTGLIGYVMMNSPTIGVAFEKICIYQKLIGESMGMRVEADEDYFTVFIEMWTGWRNELRYTQDVLLGACLSWAEKNTISRVRPLRIGVHYEQPANYRDYEEAFMPAPVEFGVPESYLVYARADMDSGILSHQSELMTFFEQQVKEQYHNFMGTSTAAERAKKLILKYMEGELPGIEMIASEMAMSVRSLQKALKGEGTSYQKLLNGVRKELAIDYLKKGTFNMSEIAFLLGFSELTVFSRSFKKWTGYSPTEFPF
ncbi:MAG: AraC family transcriptional regulator [Roseivirga sp.]|nr:AraC family transcriptional regulator [Roseivirga sp.]